MQSDHTQTRMAVAALAAAAVKTLGEGDQSFQQRFLTNLEAMYRQLEDVVHLEKTGAAETLIWTREFLSKA